MHTRSPKKMEYFRDMENQAKGTFKTDVTYDQIIKWKPQIKLFDDSFNECDSGHCGL